MVTNLQTFFLFSFAKKMEFCFNLGIFKIKSLFPQNGILLKIKLSHVNNIIPYFLESFRLVIDMICLMGIFQDLPISFPIH